MGSLKKNTTLEYSTRVVQEGDRRCEKSTLNDLAYLTPLRIPLMNPVYMSLTSEKTRKGNGRQSSVSEYIVVFSYVCIVYVQSVHCTVDTMAGVQTLVCFWRARWIMVKPAIVRSLLLSTGE